MTQVIPPPHLVVLTAAVVITSRRYRKLVQVDFLFCQSEKNMERFGRSNEAAWVWGEGGYFALVVHRFLA